MTEFETYERFKKFTNHEPRWYALHDVDPSGVFEVKQFHAKYFNENGHGIFHAVNGFSGRRLKENLTRVVAWFVDLDFGSKESQMQFILSKKLPMWPSWIVETARGYHLYWFAKDGDVGSWDAILSDRIIPFFNADKRAKDICRILRVPGFMHMKNPQEPFLVKTNCLNNYVYTRQEMLTFWKLPEGFENSDEARTELKSLAVGDAVFERIWGLDQLDALTKLSGSEYVRGESYEFRKNSNGNFNIFVDGKSTSCFIDKQRRIGSFDGGGPTIFQWLRWYGHSGKDALGIIRREIFDENQL